MLNYWTKISMDFASQRNYLDELFKIYPAIPDGIRSINDNLWNIVEESFNNQNNILLIKTLLKCDLFI